MDGVIVFYKEQGITSHDAVFKLRKLCGTKKVGHAGTLDPMATGVLPILVGNAVKASQYVTEGEKHYCALMKLGISTDTEDITGRVLKTDGLRPSLEQLRKSAEHFLGEYLQVPPMYSALKVNGKKLYELARENITVEREARPVTVSFLQVDTTDEPDTFRVEVRCSKGTYIRTLIVDLAARSGALATMSALERISCGGFSKEESYSLSRLQEAKEQGTLEECLIPTRRLFSHLPQVRLSSFYHRLALNGQPIYTERARIPLWEEGLRVSMLGPDGSFFALGECVLAEEGRAVKPIKQFPVTEG